VCVIPFESAYYVRVFSVWYVLLILIVWTNKLNTRAKMMTICTCFKMQTSSSFFWMFCAYFLWHNDTEWVCVIPFESAYYVRVFSVWYVLLILIVWTNKLNMRAKMMTICTCFKMQTPSSFFWDVFAYFLWHNDTEWMCVIPFESAYFVRVFSVWCVLLILIVWTNKLNMRAKMMTICTCFKMQTPSSFFWMFLHIACDIMIQNECV
jgi:hypothetical protein